MWRCCHRQNGGACPSGPRHPDDAGTHGYGFRRRQHGVIEEVDEDSVSLLRVKEDMLRRRGAQLTTEGDDAPAWHDADEEDEGPMLEEDTAQWLYEEVEDAKLPDSVAFVLDLVSWSIPFVFAFELLNLLVQKQYNHETTVLDEIRTLLSRIPRTCIVD